MKQPTASWDINCPAHSRWDQAGWGKAPLEHKPCKPPVSKDTPEETCPYCRQPIDCHRSSILAILRGAAGQLVFAIWMMALGLLRCVRFALASVLCFAGFLGACCRSLGLWIAHPADRRLLDRTLLDRQS